MHAQLIVIMFCNRVTFQTGSSRKRTGKHSWRISAGAIVHDRRLSAVGLRTSQRLPFSIWLCTCSKLSIVVRNQIGFDNHLACILECDVRLGRWVRRADGGKDQGADAAAGG
jgi:hypothetical protein